MTQLPWESPGVTALVVPAPEAEPVLAPLRGEEGVPAHIPHVTVAAREDEDALDVVAAEVGRALPIACAGDTVQLLQRGDDLRWHERLSWRLR